MWINSEQKSALIAEEIALFNFRQDIAWLIEKVQATFTIDRVNLDLDLQE